MTKSLIVQNRPADAKPTALEVVLYYASLVKEAALVGAENTWLQSRLVQLHRFLCEKLPVYVKECCMPATPTPEQTTSLTPCMCYLPLDRVMLTYCCRYCLWAMETHTSS